MNGVFTPAEAQHLSTDELIHYASCGLVQLDWALFVRVLDAVQDMYFKISDERDYELSEAQDNLSAAESRLEEANERLEKAGLEGV